MRQHLLQDHAAVQQQQAGQEDHAEPRLRDVPVRALTDAWAARSLVPCVRGLAELPAPAQLLARHLLEAASRERP